MNLEKKDKYIVAAIAVVLIVIAYFGLPDVIVSISKTGKRTEMSKIVPVVTSSFFTIVGILASIIEDIKKIERSRVGIVLSMMGILVMVMTMICNIS